MRPEPNKDIDLLLRQLARRDGAPASEIEEQHLDADELNSYVANALPAAAHARYTEHVADCSSCRKIVAQLSAEQGPVAVQESAAVVASSGLKSFLASLFSPMVMRYAVPALGLIVIVVVGIVVLREDHRGTNVARVVDTEQNKSVSQAPAETAVTQAESPVDKREAPQRAVSARVAKDAPAPVANQAADRVTTAEAPPAAPKAAPAEQEAYADAANKKEKKAEAPQPAGAADSSKQRADDAVKNEQVAVARTTPGTTVTAAPSARRAESRPAKTGAAAGAAGTAGTASSTETKDSRDRDESSNAFLTSEARAVAGRRFRKSGGVWIDTAYKSSSAITNVTRGSEQYRALVADEPSIRTIAEELEGQIIVVWKGRTYRIR